MPEGHTERPGAISTANRNVLAATVLVDELLRNGVRDVCISPGSRSAPLTLAFARRAEARSHLHIDERCAAFFALGLARAARQPVALVCTSGSAAANYHPAMVEAFETGVPLIVLGADRPPRLVGSGANQTTEQRGLFGPHVLRSETFDLPRAEGPWLGWLRARLCHLVELATGPRPGPIHINLPFDEPLSMVHVRGDVGDALLTEHREAVFGRPGDAPFAPALRGDHTPSPEAVLTLMRAFARGPGLIVVGPLDAPPALAEGLLELAGRLGVPLVADPLSGLRSHASVIATADAILRAPDCERLRPRWVLSFGRAPVSKPLGRFLAGLPAGVVFQVDGTWRRDDPEHTGRIFVRADPAALLEALEQALEGRQGQALRGLADPVAGPELAAAWSLADSAARRSLERSIASGGFLEGEIVRGVLEVAPDDGLLWVASSMPVRDVDAFATAGASAVRVLASRGVSGIDGLVSTTYGAEAAGVGPTVGLLGDLAALHDVGGLAAVRRLGASATLVVINNGGGAIFEHLPLATTDAPLATLFVAEHEQTFEGVAAAFGLDYARPTSRAELSEALRQAIASSRAHLIEVWVDRAASLAWHRQAWRDAADAVSRALE